MTVLLLDDERSFADYRPALVARSTFQAIELTDNLTELDELWLDYVLKGTDSTDDYLSHLRRRQREGNPLTLHKVTIHTSSYEAAYLLREILTELGVPDENIRDINWRDELVDDRSRI